jgi:cyclase
MSCSRRQFLTRSSALLAGGLVLPRALGAWQAPAPTATRFETIRRNVGIFTGRGGTIGWLVAPEGVIVVDSQFADTAQACLDGLKGKAARPPDTLINTHHHGDHVGGNGVFRPVVKRIVGHVRVPELQRKQAAGAQTTVEPVVPDTTFDEMWHTDVGDETVRARHYGPAHTGGDAVITFEKAQVTHMGDLMFHQRHPFVDRPAGASIRNWITTLERVVADQPAETIYIFGHAKDELPVTGSAADLKAFRDYLSAVLEHVEKARAAGQSKETATAVDSLRGFESYQGAPPRLTLPAVLGVAWDEVTAG